MRGIARRLDLPSGHIFYHLKKMVEMGILKRNQVDDKIFYTPQKMFTSSIEDTTDKITEISLNIDESDPIKLANCIAMFLKCYDSTSV